MSKAAADLDRRIANVLEVGRVVSVDPDRARARVAVGDLEIPDAAVGQYRAGPLSFWWMPAAGEQVLVASPGGQFSRAIILASIFAGNAPSSDPGTPMIALGGGILAVDGTLEVTGDVIAQGISLVEHTHPGVQAGSSDTGEPQ